MLQEKDTYLAEVIRKLKQILLYSNKNNSNIRNTLQLRFTLMIQR